MFKAYQPWAFNKQKFYLNLKFEISETFSEFIKQKVVKKSIHNI